MNLKVLCFALVILLAFTSCRRTQLSGEWLIPQAEVFDGGPGKDGIPSVDNPQFVSVAEASSSFMDDGDFVVGFRYENIIRAYPHPILDWHEIINDELNDLSVALVYCPLTGTATAWNRFIEKKKSSFGVSGLLYNTNIIPYDRKTDSNWSQMRQECVNGELVGTKISTYQVVETNWKTWKSMYPNSEVVSDNTGFSRNYSRYPYGDYRTNNNNIIFPVSNLDTRVPAKERVLGVIMDDKVKAFRFQNFANGLDAIEEEVNGVPIVVAGDSLQNFMVAFHRILPDNNTLSFTPVPNALPVILQDQEGNKWDVFGVAVEGPRMGQRLTTTQSFIGYWFAWGTFYEGLDVR